MYLQCRHVRTSSDRCRAAAIKDSHWCYYHGRLHQQQEIASRRAASLKPRLHDGTFATLEESIGQGTHPVRSAAGSVHQNSKRTWQSGALAVRAPGMQRT